jgi:acyl-CoA reductase-like NAD-dependent aldehyde dehydrogenase
MVHDILIGGEWRRGAGPVFASLYPADGSVVAEIAQPSLAEVNEAIEAADHARRQPNWAALRPHERASILHRIGALISERHEELAQLQRTDNGKPIAETRGLVASAAGTFRYFAAACETLEDAITPSRGEYLTLCVHEPMGVVATITPWNSPIASDAQKLAPALAAGNAVVMKPSELTPLLALELGRICEQAGVPRGVVSVLPGDGATVGDAIVRHPLVRRVSFTGGTRTGRAIASIAAEKLMPVSLELGGKSPNIVFDDADFDHALAGTLFSIFSSAGQACIAGSRLFVQQTIYDRFLAALIERTRQLRVGDPANPATQLGPLIGERQFQVVDDYVQLGLKEGGRATVGGARLTGGVFDQGFFYAPTILEGLSNRATVCREEIFGPVLVAIPFRDEDDLIAQANDSAYGLAAGIWTQNFQRAWRVARALEAGTVWINTYKQLSVSTPFGGVKESGLGREKGRTGIWEYCNQKSIYIGTNPQPLPWAR